MCRIPYEKFSGFIIIFNTLPLAAGSYILAIDVETIVKPGNHFI
jgi:hypothetical protein